MNEKSYRFYIFCDTPEGDHLDYVPEIRGQKCVATGSGNLLRDCDEAMEFIARMARGDFDIMDYQDSALNWLADKGYEKTYQTLIKE